ncbi:MAG TPA: sugar ABC transporter permease [Chloroflexota bacterium]|nr:sugar ABC transporter permease [Chloroflexota bacterium]
MVPLAARAGQVSLGSGIRRASPYRFLRRHGWSYLFLIPLFALVLPFVVYPLIASVEITLYDWDGIGHPTRYVGLDNFARVIHDPLFWNAFAHTFEYAGVLVPIQLTLALALALVLNNPRLRGAAVYRAIYFAPVVTSAALVGIVVSLLLTSVGQSLNHALLQLGLVREPVDWLGSPTLALPTIIAVGIWHTFGYNLVYFLAGLQSIPRELFEAAAVDGANAWQRFRYITVPMLREVGAVILFLAILGSLQVFDLVLVMTGGGPYYASEVVSTYIYRFAFTPAAVQAEANVGYASAAAFLMGLLVMGLTALQFLAAGVLRRQRAEAAG